MSILGFATVSGAVLGLLAAPAQAGAAAARPHAQARTQAHIQQHARPHIQPHTKPRAGAARPAAPAATPTRAPASTPAAAPAGGSASTAARTPYQIAASIVPGDQLGCFSWIIQTESSWNVTASNASSGAYGLGQALPATKMQVYGSDYRTNPATQLRWALSYMEDRYGSPCQAKAFHVVHGWY